jgi:hypothetical protein
VSNESRTKGYPAKVARVIDNYTLVLNRGSNDGVKVGQRFLIYRIDEEPLWDPDTGESLGELEIVCGVGEITYVQKQNSTVSSTRRGPSVQRSIRRHGPYSILGSESETVTEIGEVQPFDHPKLGDLAKPV